MIPFCRNVCLYGQALFFAYHAVFANTYRIASLANELGASVQQIDLEPYHPMGEGKNQELGRSDIFHSEFASADSKKHWQEVISGHTATPVHLY